jgi:lauroyl/myristoyl acyltransferase
VFPFCLLASQGRHNSLEPGWKEDKINTKEATWTKIEEILRFWGMRNLLTPAARILPMTWAMRAADAWALSLLVLPRPGRQTYWSMRAAFGRNRPDSLKMTWQWLAQPFRDFIICKRLLHGIDVSKNIKIIEKNTESINSLRNSGEAYIIAGAHFIREAEIAIYLNRVTPGHIWRLSASLPTGNHTMDLRIRLQLGTMHKAGYVMHRGNLTLVYTGPDTSAAATLYSALATPGNVALINIDAPYAHGSAGSFSRPFAGYENRTFSKGAAALARLARCPIISCVWYCEPDGTVVIEWGQSIRPAAKSNRRQDVSLMNQLLDNIELAIGKRPSQYILQIGCERCWNPDKEKWEPL